VAFGPCFDVLKMYQTSTQHGPTGKVPVATPEMIERAYVTGLRLEDDGGVEKPYFKLGEPWTLRIRFQVVRKQPAFVAGIGVRSLSGTSVQTVWTNPTDVEPGEYEAVFRQGGVTLSAGAYIVLVGLSSSDRSIQQFEALQFDVLADQYNGDFVPLPAGAGMIVNSMERTVSRLS
jgi:hypothetical protein